jgi:hypothetical protein
MRTAWDIARPRTLQSSSMFVVSIKGIVVVDLLGVLEQF